jgi:hypothetical protein
VTTKTTRGSRRWWSELDRRELTWLFVGLGLCVLLFGFVSLAGEVTEGDTQAFDTKILRALRDPVDPSRPIGPAMSMAPSKISFCASAPHRILSTRVCPPMELAEPCYARNRRGHFVITAK